MLFTLNMAASLASSSAMKWAAGGWSFFIVENLVLSENRTALIEQLGEDGYHYLYGTLSTGAMVSVGYAYLRKVRGASPLVAASVPTPIGIGVSFALHALALGMASQSFPKFQIPVTYANETPQPTKVAGPSEVSKSPGRWKVRCPFDFSDSLAKTGTAEGDLSGEPVSVHGLDRITRHPGLWSFGLLGVGNALLVPSIPQRLFLSMPLAVAAIGGWHTDSRHRRNIGGTLSPELNAMTSNVPFLALNTQSPDGILGSLSDLGNELKWSNIGIAAFVSAVYVAQAARSPGRVGAGLAKKLS